MTESHFEIYIASLTGKTIVIHVHNEDTIVNIKRKISEKEGIQPSQQRLVFNSKNLFDEHKSISYYGITAGSTLNLLIRLGDHKSMQLVRNYTNVMDDEDHKQTVDENIQGSNENWYYLESVDVWKPLDPFIALMLCHRYNEKIRNKTFALFSSSKVENDKKVRYLFQLNEKKPHEMFEPHRSMIAYGYLDSNTRHMTQCDVPPNKKIEDDIEMLYLLNTNQSTNDDIASKQQLHVSQLPHPANAFLFGIWFGELIYAFGWMTNEEMKLQNYVIKNNMDSLQFSELYLVDNNKKLFKRVVKDTCGLPFGVSHLLYNYLENELRNDIAPHLISSYDVCQVIHEFFMELKHAKITEIQLIFFQNEIHSTDFFNQYLKTDNPFITKSQLTYFLKHILSLKATKIQRLIPDIKSAFQIRVDDKYEDKKGDVKYNIDRRRAGTLIRNNKRNIRTTSFNIWLPRNVLYTKDELIKQQNDVKRYINKYKISSQSLREMQKKQFVKELHSKCQIPVGPLNLLYDNLPTDDMDQYTANEIVEFIFNFLYELRQNNIERTRDRCIASNITDEQFATTIAPNSNRALSKFLRNTIKIKHKSQINKLVPKIQRYAQRLYPDIEIAKHKKQNTDDETQNGASTAFGTWLSELCFERSKLTKQQQAIHRYISQMENIKDINEWEFSTLCTETLKLDTMDTARLMNEFAANKSEQTTKKQLIEDLKKILYDIRSKHMTSIRSTCNILAQQGINDQYFLHEIVVNDVKLEKFLIHNIGIKQLNEIPQLIKNIRKHLEALHIIKSEENQNTDEEEKQAPNDNDLRTQTIYGNKVGRWIGNIIHNRLRYLIHAKNVHDFLIINHWDSGILPIVGQYRFIREIQRYAFGGNKIYGEILRAIWNYLERRYINNPDAFNTEPKKIAQDVLQYMREIRRAYIYQIAVECSKDVQCVDAKAFYTTIASNKKLLRQFINRILKKTNQETLIASTDIFGKESIVEQIYYLLSVDLEDNTLTFAQWMSNMICDPVTLWLNIAQIKYFLAEENIHNTRVQQWGKKKFILKASKPCKSLTREQLNLLYEIAIQKQGKDDILETISEILSKRYETQQQQYHDVISLLSVDKQSFLSVTAINVEKCIEFIDKDIGIKYNERRDLVTAIVERLRLYLKIHTSLVDNQFNDKYEDAIALFSSAQDSNTEINLKVEEKNEAQDTSEYRAHSEWLQQNMLDIKEFNNYQLVVTLCSALLSYKPFEEQIVNIYRRCYEVISDKNEKFRFDGSYITKYISSAKKQYDVDKKKEIVLMNKRIETQKQDPWKYKQAIHELTAKELTYLVDECLLNTDCISYYKQKMENIAQKIIDTHMSGFVFVNNLKASKNIFVHRMMQCFGDEIYLKLVKNVYADIHTNQALCDEIKKFDALKLSNYLKRYQTNKVKKMIMDSKMNGKKFIKYKRYSFAYEVKQSAHLPLGVATMLYKKMKTFKFEDAITNKLQSDQKDDKNVKYKQLLQNEPSIEFISLIKNTFNIDDDSLCNILWNTLLNQYDSNKLQHMNQRQIIQFMYGCRVDHFSNCLLSDINHDKGNKYTIAKHLIQQNFQWFVDETKYLKFNTHFNQYIAEYFRSDLMVILIHRQKYNLLKTDMIHFLWRLHSDRVYYPALRGLDDNAINAAVVDHRKGYNAENVDAIMQEVKEFIKDDHKWHQNKKIASWEVTDIECYLVSRLLKQMNLMHDWCPIIQKSETKLCVLDILLCIQYISIFIQECVQNPANDMVQLMERKAKGEALYNVNHDVIPRIVSDIFVSWIEIIVPDSSDNKPGILRKLLSSFLQ